MSDSDRLLEAVLADPTLSDQLKRFARLEAIFFPEVRRRRNLQYEDKPIGASIRYVHYTSAEAAIQIIRSKRIWMRSTTCMSDFREVQHGFSLVHSYFADDRRRIAFAAALNACHPGTLDEAIKAFDAWWGHTQVATYICSLSEHYQSEDIHGRLSMWRAFGGLGTRVAIVMNIPAFSQAAAALNVMFSPVSYLSEAEAHAVLDEIAANIAADASFLGSCDRDLVIDRVFTLLIGAVTCLKHEGFKEEREWRAVYSPRREPSPLMEREVRVVGGVPQSIYKIPLDATLHPVLSDLDFGRIFDRLIIGPSQFPSAIGEAFQIELEAKGVKDASSRIFASQIPIRS